MNVERNKPSSFPSVLRMTGHGGCDVGATGEEQEVVLSTFHKLLETSSSRCRFNSVYVIGIMSYFGEGSILCMKH